MTDGNEEKLFIEIPKDTDVDLFKAQYSNVPEEKIVFYNEGEEKPGGAPSPADPPPADPPADPHAVEEKFKEYDWTPFGVGTYDELKERYTALSKGRDELSVEIERLKKQTENVYGDPILYKLDKIRSESTPEEYEVYKRLALGTPDAIEMHKLNFIRENPTMKDKADVYIRMLQKEYPDLFDPEADKESDEYQTQSLKFSLETKRVTDNLMKRLESIDVPNLENVNKEKESQVETFKKSWEAPFKTEVQSKFGTYSSKVEFNIDDKEDYEVELNIPIDEKEQQEILSIVNNHAITNNVQPNAEGIKYLNDLAKNLYFMRNSEAILKNVAKATFDDVVAEVSKKYNNSSEGTSGKKEENPNLTPAEKENAKLDYYLKTGQMPTN